MAHSLQSIPRDDGIKFHDVVEVLESDNRITTRLMNPNGGIYHSEEVLYDDDSNSFHLGSNDENEMNFFDALEDDIAFDDYTSLDLLQNKRFVAHISNCVLEKVFIFLTVQYFSF
jgi:hypothetical protein